MKTTLTDTYLGSWPIVTVADLSTDSILFCSTVIICFPPPDGGVVFISSPPCEHHGMAYSQRFDIVDNAESKVQQCLAQVALNLNVKILSVLFSDVITL